THQEGKDVAIGTLLHAFARHGLITGHIGGFTDLPHIQQVMGYVAPFFLGEFGCADVHAPVQLHGVGVDDLGAPSDALFHTQGPLHGRVRFADGREADDRDYLDHYTSVTVTFSG